MDTEPKINESSTPEEKLELSFLEQVALINAIFEASKIRNDLVQKFSHGGDSDDFYAVHINLIPGLREQYNQASKVFQQAFKNFDDLVQDQEGLLKKLKSLGENEKADWLNAHISVKKYDEKRRLEKNKPRGLLSRILRRK